MVDYQGPELIRGLVRRMKTPVFNRVSQIRGKYRDFHRNPLSKQDVATLRHLERISITKVGPDLTPQEIEEVKNRVPLCRLAAVNHTASQMEIALTPGTPSGCTSR